MPITQKYQRTLIITQEKENKNMSCKVQKLIQKHTKIESLWYKLSEWLLNNLDNTKISDKAYKLVENKAFEVKEELKQIEVDIYNA